MRENKYFEALGKPFPISDVLWRFQYLDKVKLKGFAVPYIDARAIADRLDSVVGQNRWKDSYTEWHGGSEKKVSAQLCTIYIYDDEIKEWIGKTDGAENTDIEPVKGGLSDSFKRAAVKWNIGRYLYKFQTQWVDAEQQGKNFVIAKADKEKLNSVYIDTVKDLFGEETAACIANIERDAENRRKNQYSGNANKKPQKETPQNTQQSVQEPQTQQNSQQEVPVYEVSNVKVENKETGAQTTVELLNGQKKYRLYMRGADERLKPGAKITKLRAERKENAYGAFNMLNGFEMAA